jgi:branched-chain amino acid transport system ATP-binding protein
MLTLTNVHAYYADSHVLHGVSMEVQHGSAVGLLGRNGMGKTTTIRSIMGLNPPRLGRIVFKGNVISGLRPFEISQLGIGLVPQGRQILPSLSVLENLTIAARTSGKKDFWNIDKVYSLFPILKNRAKNKGDLLSGGEQQMLAIARALMINPDLLMMDEPSEGLAPIIVKEVGHIIKRLKESGISILLVEQNLDMALEVVDYVYLISKGIVVYECTPDELLKNEEIRARYIGIEG